MNKTPIILALLTALSMATGQLMFKFGAVRWQGNSLSQWAISFLTNPILLGAVFLYAVTILIWIYVLKTLPLSIAYPLTALSYVLVPLLSMAFLHERISFSTVIGSGLIICGVAIMHLQRG